MRLSFQITTILLISSAAISARTDVAAATPDARTVIHISVDGLRGDAITVLGATELPNFFKLRSQGAYTDNARSDVGQTITLPNHTTQITGRPTGTDQGHAYTSNGIPGSATTLHRVKGEYIASVFDVVHDHGLSTALFASKLKFVLYQQSYSEFSGAPDTLGDDQGRKKIDIFDVELNTAKLVDQCLSALRKERISYTLLHLRDPDSAGHMSNWDLAAGSNYLNSIIKIDRLLGEILSAIESDDSLRDRTAIILTSDHGGRLNTIRHEPANDPQNYIIPFYIWGPGVARGAELYSLNRYSRSDPELSQPPYAKNNQPIRNGDSANLALKLLGLEAIRGSTINAQQDLRFQP